MSRQWFAGPVLAVALLAGTASVQAAQTAQPNVQTPAALHAADLDFVLHAASSGQAEVALAQLAEQKATTPEVKQFAQRMVKDHTQANQKLMQIAQAKGTNPPNQVDATAAAVKQTLSALAAPGFDKEYMAEQVAAHHVAIALFQAEADGTKDPELKNFAQSTLPTLKEHLQEAEKALDAAQQQANNQ